MFPQPSREERRLAHLARAVDEYDALATVKRGQELLIGGAHHVERRARRLGLVLHLGVQQADELLAGVDVAGQRHRFDPGGAVDVVAAAARPAGGIARPALGKPPASVLRTLFPLFYLVEIRHRQLLQSKSHPLTGADAHESTMRICQLRGYRDFCTSGSAMWTADVQWTRGDWLRPHKAWWRAEGSVSV